MNPLLSLETSGCENQGTRRDMPEDPRFPAFILEVEVILKIAAYLYIPSKRHYLFIIAHGVIIMNITTCENVRREEINSAHDLHSMVSFVLLSP
jgi:hypothetical protein